MLLFARPASADELGAASFNCENEVSCARRSVVSVLPLWPANTPRGEEPEGSGIVVASGRLIATADHVIGAARKVLVRTISGEVVKADIVLRDAQTDIALLRVENPLQPFQYTGYSKVGTRACALGNGFGLDISVTCGVISAVQMSGLGFNRIEDFVQTDAAVNPGMSGGALVNSEGRLVGMLSAIFTKKSDSNVGVNFAVSTPLLQRTIEDFLDDGTLQRVASGILLKPALTTGEAGLAGAKVVRVVEGSSEAAAGVLADDIIVFAGKRRIKRAGAYLAALALLEKGDSLNLEILRMDERRNLTVRFD